MPNFAEVTSFADFAPLIQQIVFWTMTALVIAGGFGVIFARSLFHSALALIMALFGVAGYFALLSAGFLAVVQLMIYVGAIAILILFAIMFDRQAAMINPHEEEEATEFNRQWWLGLPVAIILFFILFLAVSSVAWPITDVEPATDMVVALGDAFLGSYLIPFQIVGVLLSVALIGGVMLARERTKEETN